MLFESKLNRNFSVSIFLGSIPDIIIAISLTLYFEAGFLGFVVAFVALQILYLMIWFKNTIWSWLTYWFMRKEQCKKILFNYLVENSFPEPHDVEASVEEYLSSIVENEKNPVELRFKAIIELHSLKLLLQKQEYSQYFQLVTVYENAIELYKERFN